MRRTRLLIVLAVAEFAWLAAATAQTLGRPGVAAKPAAVAKATATATPSGIVKPPVNAMATLKASRIEAKDVTSPCGTDITLYATLFDQLGGRPLGKNVYISRIGGREPYLSTKTTRTDANGVATSKLFFTEYIDPNYGWLPAGQHEVDWRFDGDAQAQPGRGRSVLTLTKVTPQLSVHVRVQLDAVGNRIVRVFGRLGPQLIHGLQARTVKITWSYDPAGVPDLVHTSSCSGCDQGGDYAKEYPLWPAAGGKRVDTYQVKAEYAGDPCYGPATATETKP